MKVKILAMKKIQRADFYVTAYLTGRYLATISGLGSNKGTLDCSLPKRAARKYARVLSMSQQWDGCTLRVESLVQDEVFGVFQNGRDISKQCP